MMENDITLTLYFRLSVALAIGLFIGFERGWQQRDIHEGQRVAGVRTFAIVGLAGGGCGLLAAELDSAVLLGLALVALVIMLTSAHVISSTARREFGITSEIATFAAFIFAALAAVGQPGIAAAGAVMAAVLLGLKLELHSGLQRLDHSEMFSALQLLVISVIILPILPNRALGPWNFINPFETWALVVLVSAISFVGHFSIRLFGHSRGILVSGALGGLASSTALTVSFSNLASRRTTLSDILATGVILAQAVSYPRMLAVVFFVSHSLGLQAMIPFAAMTAVTTAGGFISHSFVDTKAFRRHGPRKLGPPFSMKEALYFAVLLVTITLVSAIANEYFGQYGIYPVAILAAFVNGTAAALSVAQLFQSGGIEADVAVNALVIAAITSAFFKAGLAAMLGAKGIAFRVTAVSVIAALIGFALLYWL